jgi:hypothetical protein
MLSGGPMDFSAQIRANQVMAKKVAKIHKLKGEESPSNITL